MDKIREEFEKEYDVIEFRLDGDFPVFEAGYKSRDEEIAELHESCNNYKKMYVDKMEEIKKLRDLLDRALPEIKIYTGSIKRHKGFTLYSEIVKALKESE